MADPICRWRNATPKTICEIVETLPKTEMSNENFRRYMSESKWGDGFAKTVYQFACQTALYYVDEDNIYHPRFKKNISEEEADSYLFKWFKNYYVPNPYTRGFEKLEKPLFIVATFKERLRNDPLDNNFEELSKKILKDDVGELDIFRNVINRYSGSLKIENNKITTIPLGEQNMEINVDRNDKKAFFENFNVIDNNSSYISPSTTESQALVNPTKSMRKQNRSLTSRESVLSSILNTQMRTSWDRFFLCRLKAGLNIHLRQDLLLAS